MKTVYGWVNGTPVYSADEYVYACRGFGAIESDEELMAFAEKASHGWYDAGWKRTFASFYLSDYALAEPYRSLTRKEFGRLKELQAEVRKAEEEAEKAKEWKYVTTYYFADNSIEELWRNKFGEEKRVLVEGPHGDACY